MGLEESIEYSLSAAPLAPGSFRVSAPAAPLAPGSFRVSARERRCQRVERVLTGRPKRSRAGLSAGVRNLATSADAHRRCAVQGVGEASRETSYFPDNRRGTVANVFPNKKTFLEMCGMNNVPLTHDLRRTVYARLDKNTNALSSRGQSTRASRH